MATPFAFAPHMAPTEEEFMRQLAMGGPPPAPTPGGAMTPATTPMPAPPLSLRSLLAGMVTPFGAPAPVQQVVPQQTLTGEQHPAIAEGMDMGAIAAEDPAGAEIGRMIGLGPAFRAMGAAGQGAMSIPGVREGVQGLGRVLARPAVTAPLALGGASLATASDTQAPTPQLGPRTTEAQTALEAARKRQADLDAERARLQGLARRFDPDTFDWTGGTPAERRQRVMDMQQAIGATPDGTVGDRTRAALAAYHRRQMAAIEALGPRETTIRADITKAEERRAEAERLDLQDAGSRRLRDAEPGWFEQYGPYLGAPLGFAAGYAMRSGLGGLARRQASSRAAEADKLTAQFGQGDVPERIGRLNQFWTAGSPRSGAPPFSFTPGATPFPWTSTRSEVRPGMMGGSVQRETLAADQLYQPSLTTRFSPTAATLGVGAVESGAGYLGRTSWEPELREAQAAVEQSPTEANIQRLQRARFWVGLSSGFEQFGRGTMMGGFTAAAKNPVRGLQRPDVMAAEAERGRLDTLLRPPTAPVTPPPAPPPAPLALPHSSTFQPREGGRFARGRPVYPPGDPRRGK